MTELSQEALYNLCYSAISFGDSLFELWITVTFGAILAIYFASARITPFMRTLLMALYGGTALLLTGRWAVAMWHVITYQRMLREAGFEAFPSPLKQTTPLGVLHFLMFVLGSLATLYFMRTFRHDEAAETAQEGS